MIAQADVVPYLIRRGLLPSEAVVQSDLVVVDTSRRNRNYQVISSRWPCFLLKQGVSDEGRVTVRHEAAVYAHVSAALPPGGSFVPTSFGYDPDEDVLVLELLREPETIGAYHERLGRFPSSVAMGLGAALGWLHDLPVPATSPSNGWHPHDHPPWIMDIHRPTTSMLREISSANLQLVRIVQSAPSFGVLLDELRDQWSGTALVHNDIKWENLLVAPRERGRPRVRIVDWELAAPGDPCWDVGAVFAGYLATWLFSMPVTADAPPERFMELSRYPIDKMQPACAAFWASYVRHRGAQGSTTQEWLIRALKYAAVRLIQTSFEYSQSAIEVTGTTVLLLQLSLNVLQRPEAAAVHLFGLHPAGIPA